MTTAIHAPLLSCFVFELRKLLTRRLFWIILVCLLISVVGGYFLEEGPFRQDEGFALLAAILTRSMPLASFLVMLTATLSVNEEVSTGSLRVVLLRPITKAQLLGAKLILNVLFGLFSAALVLLATWALVASSHDFSAIRIVIPGLEAREIFSLEAMRAISFKLTLATLAPMAAAGAFGTLVSVLIESEGTAVALATFLFLAMQALGPLAPDIAPFLFPTYLELPLALLGELAGQDQTRQHLVEAWGPFSSGYLAPLSMTLAFGLLSILIFDRRDVTC